MRITNASSALSPVVPETFVEATDNYFSASASDLWEGNPVDANNHPMRHYRRMG
jgi:hypothetical protein